MNAKKVIPLVVAIILGGIAAKIAMNLISERRQQTQNVAVVVRPQVVIAKRSVGAGEVLSDDDLAMGDINSDDVPQTAFKNASELIGRVTMVPVVQGQVIVTTLLAPKGMGPGLQATVPIGMRAMTLEINEITGIAGYITPGCHVDVLQTMRNDRTGDAVARTVVQNIKVTAVGVRHAEGQDGGGRSITVLVTPQQAELLELSSVTGKPRFDLRSGNDLSLVETRGVTSTELLGIQSGKRNAYNQITQDMDDSGNTASAAPSTQPSTTVVAKAEPSTRPADWDLWTIKVVRGSSESDVRFALHKADSQYSNVGN